MPWLYKHSKEFLDKTIQVWQPLSKEPLTYQDASGFPEPCGHEPCAATWANIAASKS